MVLGGDSGKVHLVHPNTQETGNDQRILVHRGGVSGVQFLPWQSVCNFSQTALLLTADHHGKLRLWDLGTDTCLARVLGHKDAIRSLDCSFTRLKSPTYFLFSLLSKIVTLRFVLIFKIEKQVATDC